MGILTFGYIAQKLLGVQVIYTLFLKAVSNAWPAKKRSSQYLKWFMIYEAKSQALQKHLRRCQCWNFLYVFKIAEGDIFVKSFGPLALKWHDTSLHFACSLFEIKSMH